MSDSVLKIFSYLPNPRVWKSMIAAEFCDVELSVVGDKPAKLSGWLWDYDARPLRDDEQVSESPHARPGRRGFSGTLYKTDAFLQTQPFGTVPCAFGPKGEVGIFESNSILRAVARAGEHNLALYGQDAYSSSRIDSFLDANLVFAREAQVYLLAMDDMSAPVYERMSAAYEFYLNGIENALGHDRYLAGESMSIADISFVCDFAQFLREGHYVDQLKSKGFSLLSEHGLQQYPLAYRHMLTLSVVPEFASHLGSYLDWYRQKYGLLDELSE